MEHTQETLNGKRVLVTGAGTGIGPGVALAFARRGADVAIHHSRSEVGARAVAQQAREMGVRAQTFAADFNDIDLVFGLARDAIEFLGGIDVLVNNSGITMSLPFDQVTVEQYDTLFDVNIRAMFFLTQVVAKDMATRGKGSVINLASVHAFHGMTGHSAYAGTKGAIVAFTREVALELAPKGIRVNAIAPGWILVDNQRMNDPSIDLETGAYNIPAGFIGEPTDIGELAVFLASDAARYIVAQTLIIDGGQMSIMPYTGHFRTPREAQHGRGYVPGL